MITVEGKQVFTELSELVDPEHTALRHRFDMATAGEIAEIWAEG
ncbi:MAG: hypothetical protein ACHQ4F_03495 [Candidatus Dormibacteria bacterium]